MAVYDINIPKGDLSENLKQRPASKNWTKRNQANFSHAKEEN